MTIPNPLVVAAAALVVFEAVLAALGATLPALSLATLVLAPGLALAGLLPEPTRRSWPCLLAAAPALGFGVASVALISLTSAGASLDPWLIRLVLALLVAVGAALPRITLPVCPDRPELLAGLGLLGAVALGVALDLRVIGGYPVPGNDWAKYVLYADEVRAHGSLLIDNPFWMLGVPFRDDPGVPAIYGAYVGLGDQPAVAVAHGIGLFAALQTGAMFALVRSFWARGPAVAAAALWAAVPLNITILGWHGLANVAAFPLLTLLLIYAACLVRAELRGSAAVGAGVTLVALAATHRLSLLVGLTALAVTALIGLATTADRRALLRGLGVAGLAAVLVSPGVVYDLVTRSRSFGGTLPYRDYLSSKLDLELLLRDLTIPFVAVVALAAAAALPAARRDRALIPLLCLLGVVAALAGSWLVHFPLHYTRMAYYLPLALVPLAAIAIWRLPGRSAIAAGVAAALVAYLSAVSFAQGDNVDRFYSFTGAGSLRGLDAVAGRVGPREVVVTDRCWSFLATWLLHTRTLPALDPSDIQPKAELPFARKAHAVLAGTPRGRAIARRLHVRFLLVDPGCTDSNGDPVKPPRIGRPVFLSRRLVVLRLG